MKKDEIANNCILYERANAGFRTRLTERNEMIQYKTRSLFIVVPEDR